MIAKDDLERRLSSAFTNLRYALNAMTKEQTKAEGLAYLETAYIMYQELFFDLVENGNEDSTNVAGSIGKYIIGDKISTGYQRHIAIAYGALTAIMSQQFLTFTFDEPFLDRDRQQLKIFEYWQKVKDYSQTPLPLSTKNYFVYSLPSQVRFGFGLIYHLDRIAEPKKSEHFLIDVLKSIDQITFKKTVL